MSKNTQEIKKCPWYGKIINRTGTYSVMLFTASNVGIINVSFVVLSNEEFCTESKKPIVGEVVGSGTGIGSVSEST